MRHAFTLIELLVVVAIIGVLAAMIFPAVGLVMASARQISCVNNLRQITLAHYSYFGENEGLLPFKPDPQSYLRGHESPWLDWFVGPYLDSGIQPALYGDLSGSPVWRCKASPCQGLAMVAGKPEWKYANGTSTRSNYEGAFYYHYQQASTDWSYLRMGTFSHLSQTPFQFCSNRYASVNGYAGLQGISWHRNGNRPTAFLDGHAKILTSTPYTRGANVAFPTTMLVGPYSSWLLEHGMGAPAHAPWDYWLDEY